MKYILLLGALVAASITASGQQQGTAEKGKPAPAKMEARREIKQAREAKSDSIRQLRSKAIADLMADSLTLSQSQRADILNINAGIEQQKSLLFKTDTSRANIGRELQHIEQQRDKMYQSVLTENQFAIYKRSKSSIINPQPKKTR